MLHKPVKRTYQRVNSMGEDHLPRFHYTAVGLIQRKDEIQEQDWEL